MSMAEFSETSVLRWMRRCAHQHEDPQTGEINITALAEGAAQAFDQDHVDGPLDDESHWIWDLAARFTKV